MARRASKSIPSASTPRVGPDCGGTTARRNPPLWLSSTFGQEHSMTDAINFPGTVEWSGENPGISLKDAPDGPFVTAASFFRVVLSPFGRGHALMLAMSPQDANPPLARGNFCFHDNGKLARYLVSDFVSHFGAWKDTPGLKSLIYRPLDSVETSGDSASSYTETVKSGDLTIRLTWSGLGQPFCFALPPD